MERRDAVSDILEIDPSSNVEDAKVMVAVDRFGKSTLVVAWRIGGSEAKD
jgi:hypothetical protein